MLNLNAFLLGQCLLRAASHLDNAPLGQIDAQDEHAQAHDGRDGYDDLADGFLVPR
jgi:hypothetical protein